MNRKFSTAVGAMLVTVLVSGTAVAQDAKSDKMIEARAVVAAVLPPDQRDGLIERLVAQYDGQVGASEKLEKIGDRGLVALFGDYRRELVTTMTPIVQSNLPKIAEAMAVAYTREFSLAELKDIHAFVQTPAGKHYFSRSASIMGDPGVAAANAAYSRDLQQIAAPKDEEFKTRLQAYLKAHPQVARQIVALERQ